jgi:hypothetical protein
MFNNRRGFSMTSHHRILIVGEEGVVLFAPEGRSLGRAVSMSWEAPDFEAQLAGALRAGGPTPLRVLFNEGGSSYRRENRPPAACREQLEKIFAGFPNRGVLEESREPEAESCLLVGIPEHVHLGRLGRALSKAGAAVSGFGMLPIEATGLVRVIADKIFTEGGPKSRWALLSGQHVTGGLRQVIVRDGQLALTRLVPAPKPEAGAAALGRTVLDELAATMTYLRRFGFADADGLDALVLCGEGQRALFAGATMPGVTRFRAITPAEALGQMGWTAAGMEASPYADALYAAWSADQDGLRLDLPMPSVTGKAA